jgi:hypothetical protein
VERGGLIFPPGIEDRTVYRFLKRGMRSVYDIAKLENELLRTFAAMRRLARRNRENLSFALRSLLSL